eukprot:TRINITY_DN56984_c0_g1_i1.p4 TRINITY_DN56984_c0_g1~~TRINITY_DN56984_c0_g1_i1.p4  ORF type:complete len:108 (+),score=6.87 TRINITY_DN56984_c0_g1_i1:151-474(+)
MSNADAQCGGPAAALVLMPSAGVAHCAPVLTRSHRTAQTTSAGTIDTTITISRAPAPHHIPPHTTQTADGLCASTRTAATTCETIRTAEYTANGEGAHSRTPRRRRR